MGQGLFADHCPWGSTGWDLALLLSGPDFITGRGTKTLLHVAQVEATRDHMQLGF